MEKSEKKEKRGLPDLRGFQKRTDTSSFGRVWRPAYLCLLVDSIVRPGGSTENVAIVQSVVYLAAIQVTTSHSATLIRPRFAPKLPFLTNTLH